MSVYNSGVKTMTVYTILSYTTYCHFAIKSFDLEGWAVGEAVIANQCYRANKSVGTPDQFSTSRLYLYADKPKISLSYLNGW